MEDEDEQDINDALDIYSDPKGGESLISKVFLEKLKERALSEAAKIGSEHLKKMMNQKSFISAVATSAGVKKAPYAEGANKTHGWRYTLRILNGSGRYCVSLYKERKIYDVFVEKPPRDGLDALKNPDAWDITTRKEYTELTRGKQALQSLPLPAREIFGEAFDAIVTHRFFEGQ